MLLDFFFRLKQSSIPVTLGEYLTMIHGLQEHVAGVSVDEFYYFSRACLVKDERFFDRYDQLFGEYISGKQSLFEEIFGEIPEQWLRKQAELNLSEQERAEIEAMGGWDKLMEELKKRFEEQDDRHQGGNHWIGTAGRSPFGAHGYNPEGVRIDQGQSRQGKAVKVWDKREYRNLDDQKELGTRNIKLALRKLRRFAREGAPEQLDLGNTIHATAKNAGLLDLKLIAERRNSTKVLLFIDVGGSMDFHVKVSEELFSAVRSEFKRLEFYYFHNFLYERVWQDNRRRHTETIPTIQLLRSFGADHKVIFVGDASMSPYEIAVPGGSVEHWNDEAGADWMQRLTRQFPYLVWLNPEPEQYWARTHSIGMVRELIQDRMFPLTLDGISQAINTLGRAHYQSELQN